MLFSIIVASYNNLENLKILLRDLDQQHEKCFELLVSIGESNDGTREYLSAYRRDYCIEIVYGHETGIYDALNKVLPFIAGKYTLCLGADERVIHPAFFSNLHSKMEDLDLAFYYTDLYLGTAEDYWIKTYPNAVDFRKRYDGLAHVHHQSAFIPSVFLQQVKFNTHFKTHADLNLMLVAQQRYQLKKINEVGILFARGGKSGLKKHALRNFLEVMEIRRRNGLKPFNIFSFLSFLKVVLR